MPRTKSNQPLSKQMVKRTTAKLPEKKKELDGDFSKGVISTGSTLLNLAISGGRIRGGGLCGGIFVEAFGPSGAGKTVLLSELAGDVQRRGGDSSFADPEARLNKQFAAIFGFTLHDDSYSQPDTVNELFSGFRKWEPKPTKKNAICGIFADSLAALSTDLEMDNDEGDKMGMKRAKEFSEQLRKFCRVLKEKNYLMVCSNQVRVNTDAGKYGQKFTTSGGKALEFYASVRLRFSSVEKIWDKIKIRGKEVKRVIGVQVEIEVAKNSVWKPYRTAPVYILFDYGVDDIRSNLQFIKDNSGKSTYTVGGENAGDSMKKAIAYVEANDLEDDLREETIDTWEALEGKFDQPRKAKQR